MKGVIVLAFLIGAVSAGSLRRFIFPSGGGGGGGGGVCPNGFKACVPSQCYCNLQCDNGFVQGVGCEFCMCNSNHGPTTAQTTATKAQFVQTTDTLPTSAATVTPSSSAVSTDPATADKCTLATTLCTARCPEGYLTDPTDCTFCVCKSEISG